MAWKSDTGSFNPRSRTGNDQDSYIRDRSACRFNPRSRTGNDIFSRYKNKSFVVSIHVPARGTTSRKPSRRVTSSVSIHVPARGTTNSVQDESEYDSGFNPRSRTGNDSNHPQISFVLFALTYAIIPINFVQRNLQHALLLTSPQNYGANPPGILCSLQTRTTLSLRCLLLEITKNIHCTTS